jgi:HK97 family phage major capsid protein
MTDLTAVKEALAEHEQRIKTSVFDKLQAMQDTILRLEQKDADRGEPGSFRGDQPGMGGSRGVLGKIKDHSGFKAFIEGARSSGSIELTGIELKTLTSLQGEGFGSPAAAGFSVQPTRDDTLHGYSQRSLTLIQALPSRPVATGTFEFQRLNSFNPAAAAQQGEGAEKAEQNLDPKVITVPVSTVASWHTMSKQLRDDVPGMLDQAQRLLSSTVRVAQENAIVSGTGTNGAMLGLASQSALAVVTSDRFVDRIGEAAALQVNAGFMPALIAMNPSDWFEVLRERDTTGALINSVSPAAPMNQSLWGMRVVASPAVASGLAYVIDPAQLHVLDRQAPTVEFGYRNDDLTRNQITILVELRSGVAVYDLGGVVRVTAGSP